MKANAEKEEFKINAAYYREALRLGACNLSEVVGWADKLIEGSEQPSQLLIDLSLASDKQADALKILNELSKEIAAIAVLPKVLGKAYERLAKEPEYGRMLARELYQIYVADKYSVPKKLELISWFDDEYDLVKQGISISNVYEELLNFTKSFKPD